MIGGVIQLFAITVVARIYGPQAFSALAVFMAMSHAMALSTTLNLGGYSISLTARIERLNFASTLVTGTILSTCLALLLCALAWMTVPAHWLPIGILILPFYAAAQAFSSIFSGLHLAAERTFWAAAALVLRPTLFLVIAVLFQFLHLTAITLVASVALAEAVVCLILYMGLVGTERGKIFRLSLVRWFASWKRHYKFYLTGGLGSYLSNLAMNTPILLGAWVMSPTQMGNFALALRLMNAPVQIIGAPIGAIANRSVARLYRDGQAIGRTIFMTYGLGMIIGLAGFALLYYLLLSLEYLLPAEWVDMTEYAPVVFCSGAFLFATSTIGFLPLLIRNLWFLTLWSTGRILGLFCSMLTVMIMDLSPIILLGFFAGVEICASLAFVVINIIKLRSQGRS
jgi:O-antigen/teichoic acid export membrane protein